MKALEIVRREDVFTTPYFTLVGKHVAGLDGDPYYSLALPDYVSVVATTPAGEFVLVRQFRPAVETVTLELPAGLIDSGGTAEQTATRELHEETGFVADRISLVGCMKTDTGRLGNRMWVFFAPDVVRDPAALPETGLEGVTLTAGQMSSALDEARFDHALHVAALLMTVHRGSVRLPTVKSEK